MKDRGNIIPAVLGISVLVALSAFLALALVLEDDSDDPALAGEGTDAGAVVPVGACLKAGLSEGARADLLSAGGPTAANAAFQVSTEQAEQAVAFDVASPATPAGWSASTRVVDHNPAVPLRECRFETILTGPNGERAIALTTVRPPTDVIGNETPTDPDAGILNSSTELNGRSVHLFVVEPRKVVELTWEQDGTLYGISCEGLSVDECKGLAETIK